MVITGSAVFVLELTMERWRRRLARVFGRSGSPAMNEAGEAMGVLPGSLDLFDAEGRVVRGVETIATGQEMANGEGLPASDAALPHPLTVGERKARAAAVRALMRARDGHFDQARDLFAEAARLDPTLDLTTVPTFWDLTRNGQHAAVEAYELAGREDDAVVLAAELAYTFRPKLVRRQPAGATSGG